MCVSSSSAKPATGRLGGVVIGFDVDNTLCDPDGSAYRNTVSRSLACFDLGLFPKEAATAYERLRTAGGALERLGLANLLHDRAHPQGLAVLCLTDCASSDSQRRLQIKPDDQPLYRELVEKLAELNRVSRRGAFEERLPGYLRLKSFIARDPHVARFREEVRRLAGDPAIVDWANAYRTIEGEQDSGDPSGLLRSLTADGATLVAITQGRMAIQAAKLDQIGVASVFEGRMLVTDQAVRVPGIDELDREIESKCDELVRDGTANIDSQLRDLWYFRCLIDQWGRKSPSFYARCLHAIQDDPIGPQKALEVPRYVPASAWQERPLRFVMVGDRYDMDVRPLRELLGSSCAKRIRLQSGKYEDQSPSEALPERDRPEQTFTTWNALSEFLDSELASSDVPPIQTPPDMLPPELLQLELIQRGLDSNFEAIRCVSRTALKL